MANDDRRRVLNLLEDGKITVDEAARLLEALDRKESGAANSEATIDDRIERAVASTVRGAVVKANSVVKAAVNADGMANSSDNERRVDRFQVEGIPTLVVENFNGMMEIVGDSADDSVEVISEIKRPELVDYLAMQEGNTILVRSKPSGRSSFLGWRFLNRGANIRVSLPQKANLDVQTSNGRASLRRIEGAGTARASNGRIEADAITGNFEMRTSNSRINATRLDGDFRLETSNGRIEALDGRGTFDLETTNGRIRFSGEILPRKASRFVTSNGSIDATLRGEPSLRLSASTSNGSITCGRDVEIQGERKKRQLEGVIGEGEGDLTLKASNGSITIE